jgi:hypothetical protein
LVAQLVASVVPDDEDNENCVSLMDLSNQHKDDLMSLGSNAESVVEDSEQRNATCQMNDDDSDNENGGKDYGDLPTWNALALKKLGNVLKKPYNKMAVRDVFVQGKLVLSRKLYSERQLTLKKQRQKQDLIVDAMIYFESMMAKRRALLNECVRRSADPNHKYPILLWKRSFKNYYSNL